MTESVFADFPDFKHVTLAYDDWKIRHERKIMIAFSKAKKFDEYQEKDCVVRLEEIRKLALKRKDAGGFINPHYLLTLIEGLKIITKDGKCKK